MTIDNRASDDAAAASAAAPPATAASRNRTPLWILAAVCLLGAVLIVPLAVRTWWPSDPEKTTPTTGFVWRPTAPPPLAPRFGSLTGWLDGQFYIIGGWVGHGAPCPPGALCDMATSAGVDGARYDPSIDTWTPIADAPSGVGGMPDPAAAVNGNLFLQTWAPVPVASYDPATDQWTALPEVPSIGNLVSAGSVLLASTDYGSPAGYTFDVASHRWTPLPAGPLDACSGRQALPGGDRMVLVANCDDRMALAFYDPATRTWSARQTPEGAIAGLNPVYADGKLVWPDQLSPVSSTQLPGIYDTTTQNWTPTRELMAPGGLSYRGMMASTPHVVLATGLVAANGSLLDVHTGEWVRVPDAPVPDRYQPVVAAGPDSLLSCFGFRYEGAGFDSGHYEDGCFLGTLTPSPTISPNTPG